MSRPRVLATLRERVAEKSGYRCGYCLTSRLVSGSTMELDHLRLYSKGGPTDEFNLWLACRECNSARSDRTTAFDPSGKELVPLFNPRDHVWSEHFQWALGGRLIIGITATGRASVVALNLNREHLIESRSLWIAAGWHPPKD
jgi:hypothetical protein